MNKNLYAFKFYNKRRQNLISLFDDLFISFELLYFVVVFVFFSYLKQVNNRKKVRASEL